MSYAIGTIQIELTEDQTCYIRAELNRACKERGLEHAAIICQPAKNQTVIQGAIVSQEMFEDLQSLLKRHAEKAEKETK